MNIMKNKSSYKPKTNDKTFQTVANKLIGMIESGKLNWKKRMES